MENYSFKQIVSFYINTLDQKDKKFFIKLQILSFIASLSEVFGLGSFMIFISLILKVDQINLGYVQSILPLNLSNLDVFDFGYLFLFIIILSGAIRMYFNKKMIDFVNQSAAKINYKIFNLTLYRNFKDLHSLNSGNFISSLTQKVNQASFCLNSLINIISSLMLLIFILITLLFINFNITLFCMFFFSILYLIIIISVKNKVKKNSFDITALQNKSVKNILESSNAFRDIILNKLQNFFSQSYNEYIFQISKKISINQFISQSPKILIEVFTLIFFIISFLYLAKSGDLNSMEKIPFYATLAYGAQKILPAFNNIYVNFTNISGSRGHIRDVESLLKTYFNEKQKPKKLIKPLFESTLEIKDLSFSREKNLNVIFNQLNFKINKGDVVGILGKSGSGKSTFLDLISFLEKPSEGKIIVDTVEINNVNSTYWQDQISYVPQNIFLIDGSIDDNITLGYTSELIDYKKLKEIKKILFLNELEEEKNKKSEERTIGEKGKNLSGGQKQRIGIARALYKNDISLLIFDEATNAIDSSSEKKIFENIIKYIKGITIIIVSHNKENLRFCNKILDLDKKNLIL